MPAYTCLLKCGRWVVVTDERESQQDFYTQRVKYAEYWTARAAAYRKNYKQWGKTTYSDNESVPQWLWEEVNHQDF